MKKLCARCNAVSPYAADTCHNCKRVMEKHFPYVTPDPRDAKIAKLERMKLNLKSILRNSDCECGGEFPEGVEPSPCFRCECLAEIKKEEDK